jgi:hypothetical protein
MVPLKRPRLKTLSSPELEENLPLPLVLLAIRGTIIIVLFGYSDTTELYILHKELNELYIYFVKI